MTGNTLNEEAVAFGAASGAYTVQATGQAGYRHLAAAAKLSREFAAEYYGVEASSIRGYLYGPSGGSFQTIGATENTRGIWDGSVPIVMGNATSIPNNFFIRAMGRLVLADHADAISNAVVSGTNPFQGLDAASRMMLEEMTAVGVPLSGWDLPDYLLGISFDDGLLGFGGMVKAFDPSYVDDFWNAQGYLGTEKSPLGDVVRNALVNGAFTITSLDSGEDGTPVSLTLAGYPEESSAEGVEFALLDDKGNSRGSLSGSIDPDSGVLALGEGNDPDLLGSLSVGAFIRADNRWDIALRSYYRHQLPAAGQGFTAYDRFRDAEGNPLYPQRRTTLSSMMARNISGSALYSGEFGGKVILVSNLQDVDAYPIHADWYAQRVAAASGDSRADTRMRIYFNENADHLEGPVDGAKAVRVVSHDPIVRQALRDLVAWVEDGIAPPKSSKYSVEGGQVSVPGDASRGGIQPVLTLSGRPDTLGLEPALEPEVNSTGPQIVRAVVGQTVVFEAHASAPAGAGSLISIDWDTSGTGMWIERAELEGVADGAALVRAFDEPGVYDITARAALTRSGTHEPFVTITNLASVRVIVTSPSPASTDPKDAPAVSAVDRPSEPAVDKTESLARSGAVVTGLLPVLLFLAVVGGSLLLAAVRRAKGVC